MATATVFVDDAVLGRLPPVCVFDGVPASSGVNVTRIIGANGLGIAWLLLLLGPPGWLGLLILAGLRGRDETLTVQLPCSPEAGERRRALVQGSPLGSVSPGAK